LDENHPFNCLSIYGIHKLVGEKYYRFYHEAYGLKTVSARIANPYGPRQQMKHSKYGIVNCFIRLALEGKPLTVYGDGLQRRDYIFNEDLAEAAVYLALTPGTEGQVFNLGTGTGAALIDMAHLVAAAVPGTEVRQVEWPCGPLFCGDGGLHQRYRQDHTDYRVAPQDFPGGRNCPHRGLLPAPSREVLVVTFISRKKNTTETQRTQRKKSVLYLYSAREKLPSRRGAF
jgi:nucleoside-diphosphate-sugar epimerase